MAMDDSQTNNASAGPENTGSGTTEAGSPASEQEKPEDRANRMNAAKAFYRAMYAGEDVAPDDFGMKGAQSAPEPQHSGPCPNCSRLESQNDELTAQKNESDNHYKRLLADFENYRKRLDREREEFVGQGIQKAVEGVLPALDDMDRAKLSLASVTDPKAIVESINLVFTRFTKCFEQLGVKQLDAIGEPFDPRMHEPVQEIETNEHPDGVVIHELRRGYTYKDKVLRPTLVNVTSNPSGVVVPKAAAPAESASQEAPANQTEASAIQAPQQEQAAEQLTDSAEESIKESEANTASSQAEAGQEQSTGTSDKDSDQTVQPLPTSSEPIGQVDAENAAPISDQHSLEAEQAEAASEPLAKKKPRNILAEAMAALPEEEEIDQPEQAQTGAGENSEVAKAGDNALEAESNLAEATGKQVSDSE